MNDIKAAKTAARMKARKVRDAKSHPEIASATIKKTLLAERRVQSAHCIGCFVSFSSEVQTHQLINDLLEQSKTVVVPFCTKIDNQDQLQLFSIQSLKDLEVGTYGVLEPSQLVRSDKKRECKLPDCQVALVPGLAFTKTGDRLGYGKGYYDRLLSTSSTTWRVALAFDCQIIGSVPATERDIKMDAIVTESGIHVIDQGRS